MSLNAQGVSDPTANKFLLDTDDVLGFNYASYTQSLRALSLSQPKLYFELRADVMKKVRSEAIGNLYKSLFNVLSAGRDSTGNTIGILGTKGYIPCFPSDRTNNFVVEVARDMAAWIEKAIEIILPETFDALASNKMSLKGKGEIVGN